jgi:hypothetical protein
MEILVIGDLYNRLFHVPSSNPELLVEYELWTQLSTNLPPGYVLPDYPLLGLMPESSARRS